MEKNQLKEKLIELQESVKWTDQVNRKMNSRMEGQEKKSSIWKM